MEERRCVFISRIDGDIIEDLKHFSESLKSNEAFACTEGEKPVNRKKNRYKDILPFDVSRVILSDVGGDEGSDYVNANYIKGASGSPAYIACQGPLPNTVHDFWRMVVECEVHVIIMACNAQEAGKHKCEDYWVEREGEDKIYGSVEIRLLKATVICPEFLVRTMRIKYLNDKSKAVEERTVCQFHYSTWPDHGVPPLVRPLLDMVRLVRDTQASETLPVLVHCSAGCGRTGTICAIDYVWGLLRQGKLNESFSLYNLVRDMRKQRVAMVQTKEQYVLVHQAVKELFKEQLYIINSHPYENIDVDGEPHSEIEAVYETFFEIEAQKESLLEKRDRSKAENRDISSTPKKEAYQKSSDIQQSRKKKSSNSPFSKQEKEVENLSEKKRSASYAKSCDEIDGIPNISVQMKPKMAKLKALFDRSANNIDQPKVKNNTISRSQSLGPLRKPLHFELLPPEKKLSKPFSEPPIRSGGKLKVPKLIPSDSPSLSKPVSHVKRSKSLKVLKETNPSLSSLLQFNAEDTNFPLINHVDLNTVHKGSSTNSRVPDELSAKTIKGGADCSQYFDKVKRRRSLESLMGDEYPKVSWLKESSFDASNKHTNPQSLPKNCVNSFACGLGIRERRNSFRRAIDREECYSPQGVPEKSSVFVDGLSKRFRETLTVKSQNGEILRPKETSSNDSRSNFQRIFHRDKESKPSSQLKHIANDVPIARLPSRNRFLTRLKTELQNKSSNAHESDPASNKYPLQGSKSDAAVHQTLSRLGRNIDILSSEKKSSEMSKRRPQFTSLRIRDKRVIDAPEKLYSVGKVIGNYSNDISMNNHHRREEPSFVDDKGVKSVKSPMTIPRKNYPPKGPASSSASSQSSDNTSDHYPRCAPSMYSLRGELDLNGSTSVPKINLRHKHRQEFGSETSSSSGTKESCFAVNIDPHSSNENNEFRPKKIYSLYETNEARSPPINRHSYYNTNYSSNHQFKQQSSIDACNENGVLGVDLDVVAASIGMQKTQVTSPSVKGKSPTQSQVWTKKQQYI